jgi:ABC-type sugar transport system permease subunit
MNPTLIRNPARRDAGQPAAAGGRKRRRPSGVGSGRRPWLGLLYLAPGIIVYAVVVIVPVGQGVWLSFFNWNGVTTATWAGLSNYTGTVTSYCPSLPWRFGIAHLGARGLRAARSEHARGH